MTAKALILSGYGLNCEEETLFAFNHAGLSGEIRHINDLIEHPKELEDTQILVIPGGFSYGDDTGSGNAFAQKMKLALWEPLQDFIARDTLTLGICNGCQILANLGLVPGLDQKYGARTVAVTYNAHARYECRWVDVAVPENHNSPWLDGIETMHIPVAHGEGRFMMDEETLKKLQDNGQIALQYIKLSSPSSRTPPLLLSSRTPPPPSVIPNASAEGPGKHNQPDPSASPQDDKSVLANGQFPYNPNGSTQDIAGITDPTGKILALMPHPERGMFTWQRDDFDRLKDHAQRTGTPLPETTDGMALFQNAAAYFEVAKKKRA